MLSPITYLFVILVKVILYLILLFIIAIIALKLWAEPVKGVCKCTTSLEGKVAVVTGGNSGIGLETAKNLAKRGAKVIIASRNAQKAEEAIAEIKEVTQNDKVQYLHLDLSKFNSVRNFVNQFNKTNDRLDILVNNAGVAGLNNKLTEDGNNKVIQINYLGHFLLTNLLLNKLEASKPSRIVNVSSFAAYIANDKEVFGSETDGYFRKYSQTKLCQLLWTKTLAKKLQRGVTVNAVHPGIVNTNIFDNLPPFYKKLTCAIIDVVFKTAKEGAQTTIHLCVAPELIDATGGFYADCKPWIFRKAEDKELCEQLWRESVRLTE